MRLRTWLKELVKNWYYGELDRVPFDNTYAWLGYVFQEIVKDPLCARKPMYIWGVAQGAALAQVLNISEISVIEFGVAGGAGLLTLEQIAKKVSENSATGHEHRYVQGVSPSSESLRRR